MDLDVLERIRFAILFRFILKSFTGGQSVKLNKKATAIN